MRTAPPISYLPVLFIVLCAVLASGCASSHAPSSPDAGRTLHAGTFQPQRTIPQDVTAPVTINPGTVAAVEQYVLTARELSAAWDLDTVLYQNDGKTCTAGFKNVNGAAATITTTVYDSAEAAQSAYAAAKQQYSSYHPIDIPIPYEGFGWQQREQAGVTFRKSMVMVVTGYTSANGPATVEMAKRIAESAGEKI